jgi:hypothetical protein
LLLLLLLLFYCLNLQMLISCLFGIEYLWYSPSWEYDFNWCIIHHTGPFKFAGSAMANITYLQQRQQPRYWTNPPTTLISSLYQFFQRVWELFFFCCHNWCFMAAWDNLGVCFNFVN